MKYKYPWIGLTAFALAAASPASAAIIAVDNFDYGTTGGNLNSVGSAGDGWAGGWGGSADPNYDLNNLTYSGTGYDNHDNIVDTGSVDRGAGSAGSVATRDLASTQTGTVWVSALANVGDRALFWFDGGSGTDTFIGINGDEAELRFGGTNGTVGSADFTTGETHLLLAKIDFDASGTDDVSFWVSPDLSSGEAGLGTAFTESENIGTGLTGIGVSVQSDSDYLDAIRIGTTFDSVTAVPEPSTYTAVLGAFALGFLLIRRRSKARR